MAIKLKKRLREGLKKRNIDQKGAEFLFTCVVLVTMYILLILMWTTIILGKKGLWMFTTTTLSALTLILYGIIIVAERGLK